MQRVSSRRNLKWPRARYYVSSHFFSAYAAPACPLGNLNQGPDRKPPLVSGAMVDIEWPLLVPPKSTSGPDSTVFCRRGVTGVIARRTRARRCTQVNTSRRGAYTVAARVSPREFPRATRKPRGGIETRKRSSSSYH